VSTTIACIIFTTHSSLALTAIITRSVVTLTVSETVAAKKTKVRAGDTAWVPLLAATITENIIVAAVVVDLQGQWIVPLKKSGKLAILMEAVAEECPWQAASLMVHNRTGLMAADQRASLVAAPLQAALWMNGTVPSQVATDWTFLGRYRNSVVGSSDSVTLYAYLLRHAVPIDSHQDATPMDWTKLDRRSVSQRLMAGDFEDLESAAAVSLALLHTSNSNEKDKQ